MTRFVKSRVVTTTFLALISFWAWQWMLPSSLAFTLISALTISVWCGIILSYAQAAWYAVRDPKEKLFLRVSLLGTAGLGLSIIALFSWSYAYQFLDQPAWMVRHPVRNWINWWFLCFSIMIWIAVRMVGDRGFLPDGALRGPATIGTLAIFIILIILYTIGNL